MDTAESRQIARHTSNRDELIERIGKAVPGDGYAEVMPGLLLGRASKPSERLFGVTRPSFCVIAQGAKDVYLGDSQYRYDQDRYLIATVNLPITAQVVEASPTHPYLSLRLDLEPTIVSALMIEAGLPSPANPSGAKWVVVSEMDGDLLEATLRLVRLLETPREASVIAPLIKREITYRLMLGEQGDRLLHVPMFGSQSSQIARAVHRLRTQLDATFSIEELAKDLGMSASGFFNHFKAVTDMSPLQFHRQMRLQEARRLLIEQGLDVATTGSRVGYDDPSHFSREYKKHFGEAPLRHVQRLRQGNRQD